MAEECSSSLWWRGLVLRRHWHMPSLLNVVSHTGLQGQRGALKDKQSLSGHGAPWVNLELGSGRAGEFRDMVGAGRVLRAHTSSATFSSSQQTQLLVLKVSSDCWLGFSSRALVKQRLTARATKQHTKHFKGYKIISACYYPNTTVQTVCHRNISCCQFLLLKLQLLALDQINKDIFSFHSIFYYKKSDVRCSSKY